MVPLGLSPLPVTGPEGETPKPASAGWQDFVSQEAVYEVVAGGSISRLPVLMSDLALSSSDDDFAGNARQNLSEAAPARFVPVIEWPEVVASTTDATSVRVISRAKPPELHEWDSPTMRRSGIGHRWWIPALAGVAATMMFATVLFTMSSGPAPATGFLEIPKPAPLKPLRLADPNSIAPEDQPAVASASLLAP
jgi:hypothetical protein